ncbi:MAG TPA: hypothetical protein ENJ43_04645, partial [Gammaproteobacteria bacterium]|nr:hypothetical protein [Gammaproteobacteria bacterium]
MKTIATTILTGLLALSLVIPLSAGAGESIEYSIARGGRLYDKWFAENDSDAPTDPHPTYAAKRKYDGKRGGDWRCKECHGWDYLGKDGAYGEGKHKTGFRGIRKAAGMAPEKIAALLRNKVHGYTDSMLSDKD